MQPQNETTITGLQKKIDQANLRISNIRRKSEKAKDEISKNRDQISKIIMEKQMMALALIEQDKNTQRLKEENQQRITALRKVNAEKRHKHKQQIQDILTAMYLVKAHDARQIRNISLAHQQKLRQISQSSLENNRTELRRAKSEEGRVKQAYWRNKLYKLYQQNQMEKRLKSQAIQQKSRNLESLLSKSHSMQQNLQTVFKDAEKSKKKYINAVYLPIKQMATLLQEIPQIKNNPELISSSRARVQQQAHNESSRLKYQPHMSFSPSTQQSQAKLKIVLDKIKRKQRKQTDDNRT